MISVLREKLGGAPTLAAVTALAMASLTPRAAAAAPGRVVVLGPEEGPIVPRLERNVKSMKLVVATATVTVCSRDVVTRLLNELEADSALCTDGDQVGAWVREGERIVLKEAVVIQGADDRSQELAAARAAMALQAGPGKGKAAGDPLAFTIVAGGPSATLEPSPLAPPSTPAETKDAPTPPARQPPLPTFAPRLVLGAGPALTASHDGRSLAISAKAEIGVSRYVALVPWLEFVPENRRVEATAGAASFRPTLFGLGFGLPLVRPSSVVIPRIGGGYAILWMHVAPESANAGSTMRAPEDLLAPVMYATCAISLAVTRGVRAAIEGMAGTSSHEMVVRIGGEKAAQWGAPLASLALRAEWVLE